MKRPVRKKKRHVMAPVAILLAALALGVGTTWLLSRRADAEREPGPSPTPVPTPRVGDVATKEPEPEEHLREDKSVYADTSEFDQVVTMYLTVRPGNAEDSTDHTWTEVNSHDTYYYSDLGIDRYSCEAILQVGDENGPVEGEFGYGETVPNATVCVRGQTSSRNSQKNYKIRIKDGMGTYKDMQTVPLNKMQTDYLRYRNKLAFDLMQDIPQMTAIRTQFVHLYVKDETEGGSGQFEDYGLYTRMEQMNKTYLEQHGLDSKGHLYKVNNIFEWYAYDSLMRPEIEENDGEISFSYYLEAKGDQDNQKLRDVLRMVNDYTISTEEVIEKYFDVENLAYYMAFHILTGNNDVGARNAYIYSPLNSEKWYILSWDCDSTFANVYNQVVERVQGGSWEQGITKFTNLVLFNRFLKVKEYRDAVDDAVHDLMENYLTKEEIRERVKVYRDSVLPFVTSLPDEAHWGIGPDEYDYISNAIPSEVEENYQIYLETLEKPWPFYVGLPEEMEDGLHINWDVAYDMDGEAITYTCILARDAAFTDVLARADGLRVPDCIFDVDLAPGQYCLRVQATNESGYTQDCFDYFSDDPTINGKRYGCYVFTKNTDGTFTNIENKE